MLRAKMPANWMGVCALVQVVMPFYILSLGERDAPTHTRHKRDAPLASFDKNVYLDATGTPLGVPSEFTARNPVGAGFEALFFGPSANIKSLMWINYIYYNQQRFVNYTYDAIEGLAKQLDATSAMAWQNRMALDMILASQGGVRCLVKRVVLLSPTTLPPMGL